VTKREAVKRVAWIAAGMLLICALTWLWIMRWQPRMKVAQLEEQLRTALTTEYPWILERGAGKKFVGELGQREGADWRVEAGGPWWQAASALGVDVEGMKLKDSDSFWNLAEQNLSDDEDAPQVPRDRPFRPQLLQELDKWPQVRERLLAPGFPQLGEIREGPIYCLPVSVPLEQPETAGATPEENWTSQVW
jgi:hypothetical protein